MRWFSLGLLLVGCTHRGLAAPSASACAPCPRCGTEDASLPSQHARASADQPTVHSDESTLPAAPNEAARVLASLFPKHLETLGRCRKRERVPTTWVEIDDIELQNLDEGQFVPVVEQRERGHFTSHVDQIRYVIRIENCQQNTGGPLRVEAVFSAWALTPGSPADWRRPRPVMWHEWQGEDAPRPWDHL